MIEERPGAAGRYSLKLTERCPGPVLHDITEGGYIIATPGPPPARTIDVVRSASMFSGIVRTLSDDRRELSGPSIAALLGDENGKGNLLDGGVYTGETLADIIGGMLAGHGNGVTPGQLKSTGADQFAIEPARWTLRRYLEEANEPHPGDLAFLALIGLAWRVNPDWTLDVDDPGELFTLDPEVLLTASGDHRGTPRTIKADLHTEPVDITDFITGERLYDTESTDTGAYDLPSPVYYTPDGGELVLQRALEQSENADENDLDAAAQAHVEALSLVRVEVRAEVHVDRFRLAVRPGDHVWVYHPPGGLIDLNNDVMSNGQVVHPVQLPVEAVTYGFARPMHVFHVTSENPARLLDLTPYVAWETGPTRLELGAATRSLADIIATVTGAATR